MRLVLLSPTSALGGGERSLVDLIASLRACDRSVQAHLIACDDGPLLQAARDAGATLRLVPMPGVLARTGEGGSLLGLARRAAAGAVALRFARTLRSAIADAQPDVIHSNGIKTHVLAAMAPVPGVPIVWHVRDFVSTRPASRRLLARFAPRAACAVAVSRAVAEELGRMLGANRPAPPVHVVYNAIDTDHFSPGHEGAPLDVLAQMPPAPSGTLRVGLVATYAKWKGQDLFLQAARHLARRSDLPPTRFYIVGGPIYSTDASQFTRDEMHRLAADLGVLGAVGLIPFQIDVLPIYRALDVVVHASTRPEPFGRTIVEAMSCGRAAIATGEGGAAELIRDGHDALAVPPRDAGALADAIARLCRDGAFRARLGAAARQTAVERFSRARLGQEILRIYREILRERQIRQIQADSC